MSGTFKAIIVGGGPTGLCLAHALSLAGIDYVLLERRGELVEKTGFALALWPQSIRILDQLGLLEEAQKIYHPQWRKHNMWPDGSEMTQNDLHVFIEQSHGHPWMQFRRHDLLELLYTRLPEQQTRILTGKKVVSIETKADGVKVLCSDGTSEEGSLVIGCDGVHSPVRGMMRALAAKTSSPLPDPEAPMRARYHALAFHVRPCVEPWEPGHMWEVRDGKYCMQFFMYEKEGVVGVFRGRPSPTDKYTRYTDEDVDAFANEIMDHPVKKDVKIKDLWEARTWAAMVNLEEGMLKQWHWDRIVLLGDSAHKMTPHAGLGLNQGWQGVVALTNILRRLLGTTPNPDTALLTSALQQYQRGAESAAKSAMFLSKLYHRVVSWHNRGWKMMDLATPYLGGDKAVWRFLCWPLVKRSLILDDIQEPRHRIGTVKWDNQSVERKVGPAEEVRATS